jgi:hypothetical protein
VKSFNNFCALLLLCLAGCGYHAHHSSIDTFSLCPVEGDERGYFSQELVRSLVKNSEIAYMNEGGELVLQVALEEPSGNNVGFRYERSRKGHIEDELVPSETRLALAAEITASIYSEEGEAETYSIYLSADYTFDHNYNSAPDKVNTFSLGQLSDYDEAYDVAIRSLYKKLADKIADWVRLVIITS